MCKHATRNNHKEQHWEFHVITLLSMASKNESSYTFNTLEHSHHFPHTFLAI